MIKWLPAALAAAFLAAPLLAQSDDPALFRTVRAIGDATSGQRIAGGGAADKVVLFGRRAGGDIVITTVQALAPGGSGSGIILDGGTIGLIRTRAATPGANAAPDPDDFALARRAGFLVFIVGEWRTPPVIWQIATQGDTVRWRELDARGRAGPWQVPPS